MTTAAVRLVTAAANTNTNPNGNPNPMDPTYSNRPTTNPSLPPQ